MIGLAVLGVLVFYVAGSSWRKGNRVSGLTALLVGINMRYKVHGSGFRISGLGL